MREYTKDDFQPNYLLFRFDTNERLDNFRKNGDMYLKNLDFFIKLEKKLKEKGKGDYAEGRGCCLDNLKISTQDGKSIYKAINPSTLRTTDITQPIYCITAKNIYNNITKLDFPKFTSIIEFDRKMIEDFCRNNDDPHVLMIFNPDEFLNRVKSTLKEMGLNCETGLVRYRDTSKAYQIGEHIEFNGPFHKEEYFSYQNEFRILVNTSVDDHLKFSIGNIENISTLIPIDTIINGLEASGTAVVEGK